MKDFKITLISSLLFSVNVSGQNLLYGILPQENGAVVYTKIIQVDSTSKEKLFVTLKDWAVNNFNSQKYTNQAEDKEGGYLVYRGVFGFIDTVKGRIFGLVPYEIQFTLKFYIKDNKVKTTVTELARKAMFPDYYVPLEILGDQIDEERSWSAKKKEKYKTELLIFIKHVDSWVMAILLTVENALLSKDKFDF